MKLFNDPVINDIAVMVLSTVVLVAVIVFIALKLSPAPEINRVTVYSYVKDHEERIKALEAK